MIKFKIFLEGKSLGNGIFINSDRKSRGKWWISHNNTTIGMIESVGGTNGYIVSLKRKGSSRKLRASEVKPHIMEYVKHWL